MYPSAGFKNEQRPISEPTVEPLRRQNLGRIMRQLPPPPKYDVGKPLFELNSKASHLLCSVVPNHRFW